jgi:hypothetical protein
MADEKDHAKSLEMRVAAIEDKLAKLNITEEEIKAYEKVSAMLGGGVPAASAQASAPVPIARQVVVQCWRCIRPIITVCECQCGPCIMGGGGGFGGGFGGFGM